MTGKTQANVIIKLDSTQNLKLENLKVLFFFLENIIFIWQVREEREERSTQDNSFLYKCQFQVSPSIKINIVLEYEPEL